MTVDQDILRREWDEIAYRWGVCSVNQLSPHSAPITTCKKVGNSRVLCSKLDIYTYCCITLYPTIKPMAKVLLIYTYIEKKIKS